LNAELEARCKVVVESLGLCSTADVSSVRRLNGGVSSDIALVIFGNQRACIKFAIEKLRVDLDWHAPIHRSRAEYAWLTVAAQMVPEAVPKLYGWCESQNGFAMEYVAGPDVTLWKSDLLANEYANEEAGTVARNVANILGRIHSASSKQTFDTTAFNNATDFESLRIEPYLRFTAQHYPELRAGICSIADQLAQSRLTLIHGDVSPKNILLRGAQPILLDAECASMGDPAFDVAFCLNHLLLKSIHMTRRAISLQAAVVRFWESYATHIDWENSATVESRVATLLPLLMLARVDGKSPVEYLGEESRALIRQLSQPLIKTPVNSVGALVDAISKGNCA